MVDAFPLEIIEKILAKLDDDDITTMLNARLVNPMWRTAMSTVLEQKCLSTWTRWKLMRYCNGIPSRLFKWTPIKIEDDHSVHICVPEKLMVMEMESNINLFISKAIYAFLGDNNDGRIIPLQYFFKERGHGEYITNFKTHLKFSPQAMYQLLTNLPNLKAAGFPLEIEGDKGDNLFMKDKPLPSLPKLKYLELWNDTAKNNYRDYFRWFIFAYERQLMSLSLAGENMIALKKKKNSETEQGNRLLLQNLTRLKVSSPGGLFFKKTEATLPLTHISIHNFKNRLSVKGLRVISDFVDKFSKTLVKLHLDIQVGDVSGQVMEPFPTVDFPKLTFFSGNFPSSDNETFILLNCFVRRFEELVTLELMHYRSDIFELVRMLKLNINEKREWAFRRYFGKQLYWVNRYKLERIIVLASNREGEEERIIVKNPGM
ncbi:unnamed protein product [Orchesella dallaii]|uniref:F-box domain-containing protein n=1 Tax=Orchesella dallaii TaxID=48710 RepID=A0ABP1RLF2_9HEXA